MAMAASGTRDGRGRFVPGMSGNPAGKKPGTLNKATLWRQAMAEGDELEGRRRVIARMRECSAAIDLATFGGRFGHSRQPQGSNGRLAIDPGPATTASG